MAAVERVTLTLVDYEKLLEMMNELFILTWEI